MACPVARIGNRLRGTSLAPFSEGGVNDDSDSLAPQVSNASVKM
jgi:hypothetical protein